MGCLRAEALLDESVAYIFPSRLHRGCAVSPTFYRYLVSAIEITKLNYFAEHHLSPVYVVLS